MEYTVCCKECSKAFKTKDIHKKLCSKKCRDENLERIRREARLRQAALGDYEL